MKKILLKLGMVCLLMVGTVSFGSTGSMRVTAATQIKIDKKTFPDKDFRRHIKKFDKNKNGYLSKKEIKAVKRLELYDELFEHGYSYSKAPAFNAKGMEYFTNVRELSIGFYRLKNFDTAKMKKLKTLRIFNSYLKVLDLRKNKNLSYLDLFQNNVTEIKFASGSKLKDLSIVGEKNLKKPDFASLKKLEDLSGHSMPYKKLDLRKCKNLKSFSWCGYRLKKGALQEISFGKENKKLKSIMLNKGSLTSVDWLNKLPDLEELYVDENDLSAIDVTKNSALASLSCSNNNLSVLDLSKNSALQGLVCSENNLSSLDLSKNGALQELNCSKNSISSLDLSKNCALQKLDCSKNSISSLDLSKNSALRELNLSKNSISSLDLSKNSALQELNCSKNSISSLKLSGNSMLKKLLCSENNLSSLEFSKNSALQELDCSKNPLTALDVSSLTQLLYLDCSNCQLTVLDTSSNQKITTLYFEGNPLKQEAEDAVQIRRDADDYVECKIQKVWYMLWKEKKEATALWGDMEGSVLEIPSSVELNGVRYPVTKFDNFVYFDFRPNNKSGLLKSYEEIKLPDSVLNVTVSNLRPAKMCKKINIPKHAKVSLRVDIDNMTVEIPEDHDYYTLKDNFLYDKKDNTKIYYVLGASGDVRIPEGVEHVGSLLRNSNIKTLSLPSTLKTIGAGFARETGMKTVDLSKTKLKKIPKNGFRSAELQKIKLPATLLEIDGNAFFSSSELEKVIIPNKVTRIGASAFEKCSKLKKVTLGRKVARLGRGVFASTAIRELTFPASVKSIRGLTFAGAKNLRKVTFMHRKKLPYFAPADPIIGDIIGGDPKVTFYVKNQKMKSSLEKKLKKAKRTTDRPPYDIKMRKWKISLDK